MIAGFGINSGAIIQLNNVGDTQTFQVRVRRLSKGARLVSRGEGDGSETSRDSSKRLSRPKLVGMNAFASVEHRLEARRVRIGAAPGNDLVLAHKSISGKHALVRKRFGRFFVQDLGSTNGTYLNGNRIAVAQDHFPARADTSARRLKPSRMSRARAS